MIPNYYEILGIDKNLSTAEIEKLLSQIDTTWQKRLFSQPEKASEIISLVCAAQEVFSSDAVRKEYDLSLQNVGNEGTENGSRGKELLRWKSKARLYASNDEYEFAKVAIDKAISFIDNDENEADLFAIAADIYWHNNELRRAKDYINAAITFGDATDGYYLQKARICFDILTREETNGSTADATIKEIVNCCHFVIEESKPDDEKGKVIAYEILAIVFCAYKRDYIKALKLAEQTVKSEPVYLSYDYYLYGSRYGFSNEAQSVFGKSLRRYAEILSEQDKLKATNFGSINNGGNERKPLEWFVVCRDNGKVLLLSKYGVTTGSVNLKWLNTFFDDAFSEKEKLRVADTVCLDGYNWVDGKRVPRFTTRQEVCILEKKYYDMLPDCAKVCIGNDSEFGKPWWIADGGLYGLDHSYYCYHESYYQEQTSYKSPDQIVDWHYQKTALIRPAVWVWESEEARQKAEEVRRKEVEEEARKKAEKEKNKILAELTEIEQYTNRMRLSPSDKLLSSGMSLVRAIINGTGEVTLGSYTSKCYPDSEGKPIKWIVLKRNGLKMLLLSKYTVADRPYHGTDQQKIVWNSCTLCKWLNGSFYENAFAMYKRLIVHFPDDTITGNRLESSNGVFLLSAEEAKTYFDDISKGVAFTPNGQKTAWWLRVTDTEKRSDGKPKIGYWAECYTTSGYINQTMDSKGTSGVRPAIWIDIRVLPQIMKDRLYQLEEQRKLAEEKRAQQWKSQGKCQYCGGELKGLFSKRCSCCGRDKDY